MSEAPLIEQLTVHGLDVATVQKAIDRIAQRRANREANAKEREERNKEYQKRYHRDRYRNDAAYKEHVINSTMNRYKNDADYRKSLLDKAKARYRANHPITEKKPKEPKPTPTRVYTLKPTRECDYCKKSKKVYRFKDESPICSTCEMVATRVKGEIVQV
jgi:hypothetical protein